MYNSKNERVHDEDGHPGCVNIALAAINIDGSRWAKVEVNGDLEVIYFFLK